ncbi:MAG: DUF3592 domain-containing protein [Chthoniobacter sp.]|nr:DUF3592 domain-containing protein [Chthoniobacter sp.]
MRILRLTLGYIRLAFNWLVSALFILLGPIYVVGGILIAVSASKTKSWPTATGIVTSSEVIEHKGGKGVSYSPEIKYRYRVSETTYDNTHISLLDGGLSKGWAHEVAAQFPAGLSIPVFYKPSHPENAVLRPGANWYMFATSGIGLAVFLVGVAICPAWKLFRKKRESLKA